jgi:hypothetical protein
VAQAQKNIGLKDNKSLNIRIKSDEDEDKLKN